MSKIYAGSTPKFLMKIKALDGTQLDPSDAQVVGEVLIYIYNATTGNIIAKFYLNNAPDADATWVKMSVKEVAAGDKRVKFYLTASQTTAAKGNPNMIQVTATLPDAEIAGDKYITKKKSRFPQIVDAK